MIKVKISLKIEIAFFARLLFGLVYRLSLLLKINTKVKLMQPRIKYM